MSQDGRRSRRSFRRDDPQSALRRALPPEIDDVQEPAHDDRHKVFGLDIAQQVPVEPESPFAQMYTRNMTTRHAELFGGVGRYLLTREQEIAQLSAFADELRVDIRKG